MFRINEEIADYLLANKRNPQIPGLLKDEFKPYVQRNTHTIGLITPVLVTDSDSHFLVEIQIPETKDEQELHDPRNHKWWLYQKKELQRPSEPFEIPRAKIDKYHADEEDLIDASDCCLELPSEELKAAARRINTLDELFSIWPEVRTCLDTEKENHHGHSHTDF